MWALLACLGPQGNCCLTGYLWLLTSPTTTPMPCRCYESSLRWGTFPPQQRQATSGPRSLVGASAFPTSIPLLELVPWPRPTASGLASGSSTHLTHLGSGLTPLGLHPLGLWAPGPDPCLSSGSGLSLPGLWLLLLPSCPGFGPVNPCLHEPQPLAGLKTLLCPSGTTVTTSFPL